MTHLRQRRCAGRARARQEARDELEKRAVGLRMVAAEEPSLSEGLSVLI
jgi:hypothetical protein